MLEQPKSLRHRKSIIGQAMDTLRGRSTNNYNENLSQENLSRKASIRDFFGTLRSSKSSGSPVTPQKDNVYATTRAQSSSPLKNETRNVSCNEIKTDKTEAYINNLQSKTEILYSQLLHAKHRDERAWGISSTRWVADPVGSPRFHHGSTLQCRV